MHSYLKQELHIIFRFNIVEIYNLFKIRAASLLFICLFLLFFQLQSNIWLLYQCIHSLNNTLNTISRFNIIKCSNLPKIRDENQIEVINFPPTLIKHMSVVLSMDSYLKQEIQFY